MWSPNEDKIEEIISFLKETQSPKNEIQKDIFKVIINLIILEI
jgi:hypothetical protein